MLTDLSDYVNIFLACDAHVQCASGSVVEHLLAKEGAAGSIPVSRFFFLQKNGYLNRYPFLLQNRAQSRARRFDVSPAGSVVASASQRCPLDTCNPSRAFIFLRGIHWIPLLLFCLRDVYRTRAGSKSRLPSRWLLLR